MARPYFNIIDGSNKKNRAKSLIIKLGALITSSFPPPSSNSSSSLSVEAVRSVILIFVGRSDYKRQNLWGFLASDEAKRYLELLMVNFGRYLCQFLCNYVDFWHFNRAKYKIAVSVL